MEGPGATKQVDVESDCLPLCSRVRYFRVRVAPGGTPVPLHAFLPASIHSLAWLPPPRLPSIV